MDLNAVRRSKSYDLAMGLPLILWFGYGVMELRPDLVLNARAMLARPGELIFALRFLALAATAAFNLLLVWLVIVRDRPVRRAAGFLPRLAGVVGTYLGVGILHLKPVPLSLAWQSFADMLLFTGALGSALVLASLGRSFAIMPEARALVTSGPYARARHPLYAVEIVTLAGTAVQFQQPWAALLALAVVALLYLRTVYEERVLLEAFPEYAAYRARVKRFGFI